MCDCRAQWFCENDPKTSLPRKVPLKQELLAPHGVDLATRAVEWVGNHMPGYNYKGKADYMVRWMYATSV